MRSWKQNWFIEINQFDKVLASDISKILYVPAREENKCSASLSRAEIIQVLTQSG